MSQPDKFPMFRIIQGGRSASKEKSHFLEKKPIEEGAIAIRAMRKRNRLQIAERYHNINAKKRRGWAPYPEKQRRRNIEFVSNCTSALHDFIQENQIDFKREAAVLARKIRDGDVLGDHSIAAQKLAMIASDPEICGKDASMAALKILVWESLIHYDMDAAKALGSIGWNLKEMPRLHKAALLLPAPIRWFSPNLRRAMRDIERKLIWMDDHEED